MKDYTITLNDNEERKKKKDKFILKYKIKEEKDKKKKIIIYYANGNQERMDYSRDFEKALLHLMKNQVKEYETTMIKYEEEYRKKVKSLNLENRLGLLAISIIAIIGMMGTVGTSVFLLSMITPSFLLGMLLFETLEVIKQKGVINNFYKMQLFLENEDKINNNISNYDNKYIEKVRNILDKMIVSISEGKKGVTINSLDKINLKELEKIVNNVKMKDTVDMSMKVYEKKKRIVLEKGKEIERQVREQKRRTFEDLLTIEDIARMREVDNLNYQYRINDENKSSFINVRDRYSSSVDVNLLDRNIKKRVKKK